MAGLSRSIFSLLEVLTSSDLMGTARLASRDVLEIARRLTGDHPIILGGLSVVPAASGVTISPGALLEPYTGVVSAPRPEESPTVLGLLRAPLQLPVPALGVDTWYLIEARAAELDTQGSILVLNQTTRVTAPGTGLVQREASLLVQARVGTATALPAVQAGWQPLAAVKQPATGTGQILFCYDLRRLFVHEEPITGTERFERHDYAALATSSSGTIFADIVLIDRFGVRLSAQTPSQLISGIYEPGYTPTAQEWAYLYLCTVAGLAPKTETGRGVLVLTNKAPVSQGSRVPGSAIVLPANWASLGAVNATCVGCLRMGTSALMTQQSCVGGRYETANGPNYNGMGALAPSTGPSPYLPRNARRVVMHIKNVDFAAGYLVTTVASSDTTKPSSTMTLPKGEAAIDMQPPLWVLGTDPATLIVSGATPDTLVFSAADV